MTTIHPAPKLAHLVDAHQYLTLAVQAAESAGLDRAEFAVLDAAEKRLFALRLQAFEVRAVELRAEGYIGLVSIDGRCVDSVDELGRQTVIGQVPAFVRE